MTDCRRVRSYVSPNVVIKPSTIHGLGMHAKTKIRKGEIVFIKGGHILRREDVYSSSKINSYLPIDDNYVLGSANPDEEEAIKLYINHSCSPNCGVRGEITFVAIRDIQSGEELTIDYAMVDNEDYKFVCRCGAENCRGIVTGFDWKRSDIQIAYEGYFARYLADKIRQANQANR